MANITLMGASYTDVPAVQLPKTGGGTASFTDVTDTTAAASDVASDKYFYTASGVRTKGTASGSSSMNVQVASGYKSRKANSYGDTGLSLTVAKSGTYKISWAAWRGSSQGTMGTNLQINNTAGTNQQPWTGTYGQCITLENQSLSQGDVLTLYATSGSNSRTIYVANLAIEQTA